MSNSVTEIYKFGNRGISSDVDEPYYDLFGDDYENLRKIMPISTDYDGPGSDPSGGRAREWGQPLKSDFIPAKIKKRGRERPIADIDFMFGMFLVSQAFKNAVEAVEPDVHQFFPVDVFWANGNQADGKFYWFNICTALDTVDPERTEASQKSGISNRTGKFVRSRWKIRKPGGGQYPIYYNLEAVQGHHIWKDKYLFSSNFYCSQVFKQHCESLDLAGLGFTGPMEAE